MEKSKLRVRIKTRARVMFPWLPTSKKVFAHRRATKTSLAFLMSSLQNSTSSLSIDQPVIEQPVISRRRYAELDQRRSPEQPDIPLRPQLPIIPALDHIDCEEIFNSHFSNYKAQQTSLATLHQVVSSALPKTASDCVFATVELLDAILLQLPVKTIFNLQRVSRTWKQSISQSKAIQEKMFLRSDGNRLDVWELLDAQSERLDVVVRRGDNGDRKSVKLQRIGQTGDATRAENNLILPTTLNPLMTAAPRSPLVIVDEHGVCLNARYSGNVWVCNWQHAIYTGRIDTLKHTADMYLSDPPIHRARMSITLLYSDSDDFHCNVKATIHDIQLRSVTGLKMADLLEGFRTEGSVSATIIRRSRSTLPDDSSPRLHELQFDDGVTVAALQLRLKDHYGWKNLYRAPGVKICLRLQEHQGLTPIVARSVERRALVES
jgi:hypothetical protein